MRKSQSVRAILLKEVFKPGVCPKPAVGRLWAHAWFPEIVLQKVCVCMHVYMYIVLCVGGSKQKSVLYRS